MELKWLEDYVAVAEMRHFARAAETRLITQSALSRRIRSLEGWVGTELIDRTAHPIGLTTAGEDFLLRARQIIDAAYDARTEATRFARPASTGVTLACLHTLALFFLPKLVSAIQRQNVRFEASIIAETRTVDEYVEGLKAGLSDIFICFADTAVDQSLPMGDFDRHVVGNDSIAPFCHEGLQDLLSARVAEGGDMIPYVQYGGTSFLSRLVDRLVSGSTIAKRLETTYRGTLAESLATAAMESLGVAWLPQSVIRENPRADCLVTVPGLPSADLDIIAYRSKANKRPITARVWDAMVRVT